MAKPVVKVYMLPTDCKEQLQALRQKIVAAACSVTGLHVKSEMDLITIFLSDVMTDRPGAAIHVEIDIATRIHDDPQLAFNTAKTIGTVLQESFPGAYVQCKAYPYSLKEGFWKSTTRC